MTAWKLLLSSITTDIVLHITSLGNEKAKFKLQSKLSTEGVLFLYPCKVKKW